MKKIVYLLFLISFFLFGSSFNVFAMETVCSNVIVDAANHTVKFLYEENTKGTFTDFPENANYNMNVSYLKQFGIIEDDEKNSLSPDRAVTKTEFVSILYRMINNTSASSSSNSTKFLSGSDANTDDWNELGINWAAKNGIITENLSHLNENQNITKEEAIVMIDRFYQVNKGHLKDYYYAIDTNNYSDFNEVSEWAKKSIEDMLSVGLLDSETTTIAPAKILTGRDIIKLLTSYHFLNERPTILNDDSSPLIYIDPQEQLVTLPKTSSSNDEDLDDQEHVPGYTENVICDGEIPVMTEDNDSFYYPSWAGYNHTSMLNRSFSILAEDNNSYKTPIHINNLSVAGGKLKSGSNAKISEIARGYIRTGAVKPDKDEIEYAFVRHYYKYNNDFNSRGTSKKGNTTNTAYIWWNNHYYNANYYYSVAKNYAKAYEELGRSIHYLQDINAPHHAMLIANTKANNNEHKRYESWVKNNFKSSYWEWGSARESYPFMKNRTFVYMSNSFSKAACDQYPNCKLFQSNPIKAQNATAQLTKRTQRAVAGLLYRFLCDTGRAN